MFRVCGNGTEYMRYGKVRTALGVCDNLVQSSACAMRRRTQWTLLTLLLLLSLSSSLSLSCVYFYPRMTLPKIKGLNLGLTPPPPKKKRVWGKTNVGSINFWDNICKGSKIPMVKFVGSAETEKSACVMGKGGPLWCTGYFLLKSDWNL